jgi:hypothetical protein
VQPALAQVRSQRAHVQSQPQPREQEAHALGNAQYPLPVGQGGQNIANKVRGRVAHASCGARGTKAAALTRESDELFVGTLYTFDSHKSPALLAAVEILRELALDEGGIAKAVLASLLRALR